MKQVCFLLLLFPLLLGGCVTSSYGLAREVRLGMTEAQVIHLLGAPQAREETPDSAKWGYHWEQPLGNKARNMELKFREGPCGEFPTLVRCLSLGEPVLRPVHADRARKSAKMPTPTCFWS